jgi:carboxyl-terminal processing protease
MKARATAILLALLSFFPFSSSHSHADSTLVSTGTREGRLAVFDDVWESIRDRYYDPSLRMLDWEEERAQFRPLAAEAQNRLELYAVIRRMVGLLHDAHTRVYAPEENFDWQNPRYIAVGISVQEILGEPVIVAVERGSEAEAKGLRAGDLLKTIDGEKALSVFTRRLNAGTTLSTVSASRSRAMSTLFEGALGSSVEVSWTGIDGRERAAHLKRQLYVRKVSLRARRIDQFSLIAFDAFTPGVAVDFFRAIKKELRGGRGLVIDLRGNGGGEAEAMVEIASAFLPNGKSLGRFTDRTGRSALEPHTRSVMLYAADSITRLDIPVVILTSERTSSAAEIFTAALKDGSRATIIGSNTCGCVLAIRRRHILPDGGQLDISEMDYRTAAGARLEGQGIAPDEQVNVVRKDFSSGHDRALERAIGRLRAMTR